MRRSIIILVLILFIGATWSAAGFSRRTGNGTSEAPQITAASAAADLSGFARATAPRPITFPADHGPHADYQTEWWYYTGNLAAADGRRFGFQLTFFRRALAPPADLPQRSSDWAAGQVYMAHFAVSDIASNHYQAFERLDRGAAGLAGAQADPYRVWLEDWQAVQTDADPSACPRPDAVLCAVRLQAAKDNVAIDLALIDAAGPSLQGDQGFSRKGGDAGQASYYYSLTRLETSGEVSVNGQRYTVSGLSWMDHEWSTSYLSKDQAGWDWFSIQLDGGGQLMVFQLHQADGSVDPFSSGLWVEPDGSTRRLRREDFQIQVTDTWKSPHTGATYPAGWTVAIPAVGLSLQIHPLMADQELNFSYSYWEGAAAISGSRNGAAVSGHGYVELTGYSGSMGGKF